MRASTLYITSFSPPSSQARSIPVLDTSSPNTTFSRSSGPKLKIPSPTLISQRPSPTMVPSIFWHTMSGYITSTTISQLFHGPDYQSCDRSQANFMQICQHIIVGFMSYGSLFGTRMWAWPVGLSGRMEVERLVLGHRTRYRHRHRVNLIAVYINE